MKINQSRRNIHGILLLDKRLGVSSNKALQEVKRLFNAQKAGHTGSLDPLATGLLPICFGEATKVSGMMLEDNKRYHVLIQLGIKTDTGDMEGEIIDTRTIPAFTLNEIEAILEKFKGSIDQVPPMYSALKLNGKKLYELARNGITVERSARRITIFELKLISAQKDTLELDVYCSKGTYIRSLAEDIGETLGCGATVKALRRTQSGSFAIEQAITFEQLQKLGDEQFLETLIDVDSPLKALPCIQLNNQQATSIKFGQALSGVEEHAPGSVRMYDEGGFLGLGEMRLDGKLVPKKLFNMNG
jgi:tRNA pseudouridine55 synthase